jgi:hypothetical protein
MEDDLEQRLGCIHLKGFYFLSRGSQSGVTASADNFPSR